MKVSDFASESFISKISDSGYCMVVYYDKVSFGKYKLEGDDIITDALASDDLPFKEIRLFDKESEYRLRYVAGNNRCENIFTSDEEKDMDKDLIFVDEMLLKEVYKNTSGLDKITIVNRYKYTDYSTITLDDYRVTY